MAFRHWLFLPIYACTSILQCLRSQPLKNASCPAFFLIYSSAMKNKHKMFRTKEFIGPIIASAGFVEKMFEMTDMTFPWIYICKIYIL